MLAAVFEQDVTLTAVLVTIHVLSAINMLGPSAAFGILGSRASDPAKGGHKNLEALLDIEHKMVLPGAAIQIITGVLLIFRLHLNEDFIANGWLWSSILMFATILILSLGVDTPAIRRIVKAANAGQMPDAKDLKIAKGLGPVFGILFITIGAFMMLKPF